MADHDISTNKEIAIGFLNAIVAGKLDTIEASLAEDASWWIQGHGELTRSQLLAALSGTLLRASTRRMDIEFVTAEADRVAIAAQGDFSLAEGAYRNSYHFLFMIADGRIAAGREYLDTVIAAQFFTPRQAASAPS